MCREFRLERSLAALTLAGSTGPGSHALLAASTARGVTSGEFTVVFGSVLSTISDNVGTCAGEGLAGEVPIDIRR